MERIKLTQNEQEHFQTPKRLREIQAMTPAEFKRYCAYLYNKDGYSAHNAAAGDNGIDLILKKRRQRIVVRCQQDKSTVAQPTIQALYDAMIRHEADRAALLTLGRVSPAAERWVGDRPVDLITGHELVNWARQQRLKKVRRNYLGTRAATIGAAIIALLFLLVGAASFLLAPDQEPATTTPGAATATPTATPDAVSAAPVSLPSPSAASKMVGIGDRPEATTGGNGTFVTMVTTTSWLAGPETAP